jgi:hypothetical protein
VSSGSPTIVAIKGKFGRSTGKEVFDVRVVRVRHDVSADPSSIALLLAGPSAAELWPTGRLDLEVSPPVRSSTGYAAALRVTRDDLDVGEGRLTVEAGSMFVDLRIADDVERDLRKLMARYLRRLDDAAEAATSAA